MKYALRISLLLLYLSGCDSDNGLINSPEISCPDGFWYDWKCYSSEFLQDWGLGEIEQIYYHNDRFYEWYIDQADTGASALNNCGPTVAVMAALWSNKTFPYTVEDARNLYFKNGEAWLTTDLILYLTYHTIPYEVIRFRNPQQILILLQQGKLLIICLKMSSIRYNPNPEERVDRFYAGNGGHFLIVKGARIVDETLLFEVYDPSSFFETYQDGSLKGKNRHYRAEDIIKTITQWWDGLIVISEKS